MSLSSSAWGIEPRSIENVVDKYPAEAGIYSASMLGLHLHTAKRGTQLRVVSEVLGHAPRKITSVQVQRAWEDRDRQL